MNKKLVSLLSLAALLVAPLGAKAVTVGGIACSVQSLVEIIFGVVAVVYFLWYGIMFLTARGDATKIGEARLGVLYGVVGVVVGGLALVVVGLIAQFFGINLVVFAC